MHAACSLVCAANLTQLVDDDERYPGRQKHCNLEMQQRTKARSATIRFPVSAAGLLIADTLCCVLSVDPNNPINAIQDSAVNNSIERLL
jgi:hypothetical protein